MLEPKGERASSTAGLSVYAVHKLFGLQQAPNLTQSLLYVERGNPHRLLKFLQVRVS